MPSWAPRPSRLLPLSILICGGLTYYYYFILSGVSDASDFSKVVDAPGNGINKPVAVAQDGGADVEKRNAVVAAFKHAWHAYEKDAMGYDEYHPLSHRGENLNHQTNPSSPGIGYTVLDALDTIQLMDLQPEFRRARFWVSKSLTFDQEGEFSTFETTIRVLGGLLSAHYLSGDMLFLDKARDLGERLATAFDTPSGLPLPSVDLKGRKGVSDRWAPHRLSTAEATTLQLEFRYLAELTGDESYWRKAEEAMSVVKKQLPVFDKYIVPIYMDVTSGTFEANEVRLGSRGDSYYEYLLKQYLQTNRTESVYKKMYQQAMDSVYEHLVFRTPLRNMTYIAELIPSVGGRVKTPTWRTSAKQDHLVCFFAGSLMLGATTVGARPGIARVSIPPKLDTELTAEGKRDWETGVELLDTCMKTHETRTGLSPEIAQFGPDGSDHPTREWWIKRLGGSSYDARYMLRPETVESLLIAYRLTHDDSYRSQAWSIFSAIERWCRVPGGGYATVEDVDDARAASGSATAKVRWDDKQETFFLSETLKYLYLIFDDPATSKINLHDHVFNTEAHAFPVFSPTIASRFS